MTLAIPIESEPTPQATQQSRVRLGANHEPSLDQVIAELGQIRADSTTQPTVTTHSSIRGPEPPLASVVAQS